MFQMEEGCTRQRKAWAKQNTDGPVKRSLLKTRKVTKRAAPKLPINSVGKKKRVVPLRRKTSTPPKDQRKSSINVPTESVATSHPVNHVSSAANNVATDVPIAEPNNGRTVMTPLGIRPSPRSHSPRIEMCFYSLLKKMTKVWVTVDHPTLKGSASLPT